MLAQALFLWGLAKSIFSAHFRSQALPFDLQTAGQENDTDKNVGMIMPGCRPRPGKSARSVSRQVFAYDDIFKLFLGHGVVRAINPEKVLTLFFNN
jgi:hypothetical protein